MLRADGNGIMKLQKISLIGEHTDRNARDALINIGTRWQRTANHAILHEKKRGRVYRVRGPSGRTRKHRASAPGQSHANITGRLRRSMGWKVRASRQLEFGYGASTRPAPDYALYVEGGTTRMRRRPSLQNAIKAERRNTIREIKRQATKALVVGI